MKQSFGPQKGLAKFQPQRHKASPTLTTGVEKTCQIATGGDRCTFVFVDNNGKEFPCQHKKSPGGKFCVFHRDDLKAKASEFVKAIDEFIRRCDVSSTIKTVDFRGFIFPAVSFRGKRFSKATDFRDCRFEGEPDFRGVTFAGDANFYHAEFHRKAFFQGARFLGKANFAGGCRFRDKAVFDGVWFSKDAVFHGCKFEALFACSNAKFAKQAMLQSNTFLNDADFRNSHFAEGVNFDKSIFGQKVSFRDTKFDNEITFAESQIGIIRNLQASGINFEGAVLESVHFSDTEVLIGCSFRNAFLLSLNLREKELRDCDFTGAVFKAVLTQGWRPDGKTLRKTQFIYTDYEIVQTTDDNGMTNRVWRPLSSSRVPATGSFGDNDHPDFTLAEYLKEPVKWASVMNVPPLYRAAVLEYLQFFTEFMRVTEDVPVQFQTRAEGNLLCVEFTVRTEAERQLIQQRFDQYKADTGKPASNLKISFNNPRVSELEKELTEMRYRDQLNRFKFQLEMVQKLLSTTQEVNQLLRERAGVWSQNPPALLAPVSSAAESECETPIFFLTADLADYSTAARADRKIPSLTLRFLSDQENRIEKVSGCERVKLEGDCIKVFGRDGKKLVQIARSLVHAFEDFALERELGLRGIRVVLGYGVCTRLEKGGEVDFAGPPIDETVRVDQPMKDQIQADDEDPNQIWCTAAFEQAMRGRNKAIEFEPLPAMTLPNGQPSFALFRVKFS